MPEGGLRSDPAELSASVVPSVVLHQNRLSGDDWPREPVCVCVCECDVIILPCGVMRGRVTSLYAEWHHWSSRDATVRLCDVTA